MKIVGTNNNFAEDYNKIKEALMHDPRLRNAKNPLKEWQTWIDLNDEDLQKLTYYLLSELVFNKPLTSISTIIPLIEGNDIMVGLSVYMDKESTYATHTIKNDRSPLFISSEDLVNVLVELINEEDYNYEVRHAYHKLAWKLHIIEDLKDKMK